jgi:hypothetical protein
MNRVVAMRVVDRDGTTGGEQELRTEGFLHIVGAVRRGTCDAMRSLGHADRGTWSNVMGPDARTESYAASGRYFKEYHSPAAILQILQPLVNHCLPQWGRQARYVNVGMLRNATGRHIDQQHRYVCLRNWIWIWIWIWI